MGIFSKLFNQPNENLSAIQKLVLPSYSGKASKSQIISAAKFMAPQWLKIAEDCTSLVNTTKNPQTFFERYRLLKETFLKLQVIEPYVKFSGQSPTEVLKMIDQKQGPTIGDFIDRFFKETSDKINCMKSQKGKNNKIDGFINDLHPYFNFIDENNLQKVKHYQEQLENLSKTDLAVVEKKTDIEKTKQNEVALILNDNWEIGISFSKSSSSNFQRALFLAKDSNRYVEQEYSGQIIYQAFFSSKPDDYLKFTRLYDLIGNWKSTSVTINGELIDRKIIGGINYCYGDKCRNGRKNFCFGASEMTDNPFGCHRLQMSRFNNPWWSFAKFNGMHYVIDKKSIRSRAEQYATAYRVCPSFDYDKIMLAIDCLPDKMSVAEYQKHSSEGYQIIKL